MKERLFLAIGMGIALTLTACTGDNNDTTNSTPQGEQTATNESAAETPSNAGEGLVTFPENHEDGVLYATVTRGNTYEEIYTSQEAIEAVQKGQPIPSGTVITLQIYRDEELYRYFVMEKRTGWGAQYPPEKRNGEWEYQSFTADKTVDYEADIDGCFSCHANREEDDFVNTYDEMESYELKNLTGMKDSSTQSRFAGITAEDWEIKASEMGEEEPEEVIQKVLLMTYFHQFND